MMTPEIGYANDPHNAQPIAVPQAFHDVEAIAKQAKTDDHAKQKLELIRQTALKRFDFFCAAICGYTVTEFHARMIAHWLNTRHGMVLAPRGGGKSLICDVAYCLWKIVNDPNIRICIASKSGPQAKSFLFLIKQHMENNPNFRAVFGDLVGETWNEDEIVVNTRTKILKEPTIVAKSVGAGMPGFHFDMIIADDLCDLENTATELQRQKMQDWFYVVLEPTLEPTGEFRVIGTRYNAADIYGHFAGKEQIPTGIVDEETGREEMDEKWNDDRFGPATLVIPAITEVPVLNADGAQMVDDKGNPLTKEVSFWEAYFPLTYLQSKRAKNLFYFNLAYQNDASVREGGIILLTDLEPYVWQNQAQLPRRELMTIIQGCDPAIGQKQTNDFFSHCTIGVFEAREIFVLEWIETRVPYNNQVQYLIDKWKWWEAELVGIETVAYQKALALSIKEHTPFFPVYETKPRIDKTMRAKIFSSYTQNHQIRLHTSMYRGMTQLAGMPNVKNDDMFDSLDIAVEAAKHLVLTDSIVSRLTTNLRRR